MWHCGKFCFCWQWPVFWASASVTLLIWYLNVNHLLFVYLDEVIVENDWYLRENVKKRTLLEFNFNTSSHPQKIQAREENRRPHRLSAVLLYVSFENESSWYHFIFTAFWQQPVKSDRKSVKRRMLCCRSRKLVYKLWCHQSVLYAF